MKILVINCGSSSLKYQLIDMDGEKVLCKGLCERIGMESSMITHEANGTKATTPAIFPTRRTVKVSATPPCFLAMTVPSKA